MSFGAGKFRVGGCPFPLLESPVYWGGQRPQALPSAQYLLEPGRGSQVGASEQKINFPESPENSP